MTSLIDLKWDKLIMVELVSNGTVSVMNAHVYTLRSSQCPLPPGVKKGIIVIFQAKMKLSDI